VALSFIEKLLRQHRETGSIAPKQRAQQTPTKLNPQQLVILEDLVHQNNDATLAELQQLLYQATGVRIGRSMVDRMLRKLHLTRKKKSSSYQKRE
jgi:transposase